jgi:DMSO/TMAO reductase YedYZ molybdopterin-dependent catalytic subunit
MSVRGFEPGDDPDLALQRDLARRSPLPLPETPPPGPFRRTFWASPLRGPWLSSFVSSLMLPLLVAAAVTGFLSHVAYETEFAPNTTVGEPGGLSVYGLLDWPTGPAWLYALNQGLHIVTGLAVIPLLLVKLWSVIPQLWEWPPVRSLAHGLERFNLFLLVGSSLFLISSGVLNIQYYYVFSFNFLVGHYYAAWIFVASFAFHVATKLTKVRRSFRDQGVLRPLRAGRRETAAEPAPSEEEYPSTPVRPSEATVSRRGLLGAVGFATIGLGLFGYLQTVDGPLRRFGLFTPRTQLLGDGPNDFQINQPFESTGLRSEQVGPEWRLTLEGRRTVRLSREQLLAMPQTTEELPIACVEGWSTTQTWTGVRLSALARLADATGAASVEVDSVETGNPFAFTALRGAQIEDDQSLLALRVNGADLSLDHGFPARVIVPALPGVHNTKWVGRMTFRTT